MILPFLFKELTINKFVFNFHKYTLSDIKILFAYMKTGTLTFHDWQYILSVSFCESKPELNLQKSHQHLYVLLSLTGQTLPKFSIFAFLFFSVFFFLY